MKISLSEYDMSRLSESAREEIVALILDDAQNRLDNFGEIPAYDYEGSFHILDDISSQGTDLNSANKRKVVVAINEEQASKLISNLSEKSVQTLKSFVDNDQVTLDMLIGENRPYSDYNELKRSFVGPVNRRLRTVLRNKSAVLFLKNGEDEEQVSVKSKTSDALRIVLAEK